MPDYQLHADYDHDRRTSGHPNEYALRQTRPGGILVANLDADSRRRPELVSGARPVDLDWQRTTKSSHENDLLRFVVRVSRPTAPHGCRFYVAITGWLQNSVRIFDQRGRPLRPLRTMSNVYPISFTAAQLVLQLEAQTLPGSPLFFPSTLGLSNPPPGFRREEGLIRLELYYRDASDERTVLDWAYFTVAPVLFNDDVCPAEVVYVCEVQDTGSPSSTPALQNHPTLVDLESALNGTGVPLVRVPPDQCQLDGWIQDQFKMGYSHTPDGLMNVVVHFPRLRTNVVRSTGVTSSLANFVSSYFPSNQIGIFQEFWDRRILYHDADNTPQFLPFHESHEIVLIVSRVYYLRQKLLNLLSRFNPHEARRRELESTIGEILIALPSLMRSVIHEIRRVRGETNSEQLRALLDREISSIEAQYGRIRESVVIHGDRIAVRTASFRSDLTDREFTRLSQRADQMHSDANYGGNIIVSPPVSEARHGKVVIGNRRMIYGDLVDPDLIRFLRRQNAQPLVEVDTSWLQVGHIDEIITFVPSTVGGEGCAILRSSPATALTILYEALRLFLQGFDQSLFRDLESPDVMHFAHSNRPLGRQRQYSSTAPLTHMMRGKTWLHHHPPAAFVPLEPPLIYRNMAWNYRRHSLFGDDVLPPLPYQPGEGDDSLYPANISVHEFLYFENGTNEEIEPLVTGAAQSAESSEEPRSFLAAVDEVLVQEFSHVPIIKLPVLFDAVEDWIYDATIAFTPNLVNMQVIDRRVIIPRPYGPRMRVQDAISVLSAVFERLSTSGYTSHLNERYFADRDLINPSVWIRYGNVRQISEQFRDGFPDLDLAGIDHLIQDANRRTNPFMRDGNLRPGWHKIVVPEGTVDLFEAYTQIVLESIGLEVRWVDTWFYHVRGGEIHCGSNVKRRPRVGGVRPWWETEPLILNSGNVIS